MEGIVVIDILNLNKKQEKKRKVIMLNEKKIDNKAVKHAFELSVKF